MQSLNQLVFKNLNANHPRTLLTILAVTFAAAASVAAADFTESLRLAILTNDDIRESIGGMLDTFDSVVVGLSIVIMASAAFLIYNAFAMSVTQRQQQIGALRAIGMTRAQIWRLLLLEAFIIGIVGVIVGILIAPPISTALIWLTNQLAPGMLAFTESDAPTWSILLAFVGGIGFTLFAMLFPARRAMQTTPLAAMREAQAAVIEPAHPARFFAGLILMGVIGGIVLFSPPGEWVVFPLDSTLALLFVAAWLVGLWLILPATIGFAGRNVQHYFPSAVTRLMADNLRRARGRVTLTILTLALSLFIVTGMTGFMLFFINQLIVGTMSGAVGQRSLFITRLDIASGWANVVERNLETILLSDEEAQAILATVGDRGSSIPNYFVTVPELSFIGNTFYSNLIPPETVRYLGETLFTFQEGDVDRAVSIMEAGCGVLMTPLVAAKNGVGLYDTFTVTGKTSTIECTVAGIGMSTAGASVVGDTVKDVFGAKAPLMVLIIPAMGADVDQLTADLEALKTQYPDLALISLEVMADLQTWTASTLSASLSGLLVLAVIAAALGVVNTTMMSITERRREIGLLRATGATRQQIRLMLVGETALMGVIGGIIGFVAGSGAILIFILTYGGNSFGLELDLWQAAGATLQGALLPGVVGLIAAPIISAIAAWLPARGILREQPVTMLAVRE
jgi:putative ABC transport system permease protein